MARPNADGEIVCTGCNRSLPGTVKYFHRHRDAFKPRCKECRGSEFGIHQPNKVVEPPDGKKICTGCFQVLPADREHFYKTDKTNDELTSRCKECHGDGTEYGINRPNRVGQTPDGRPIPEGMWFCPSCEQILPLNGRHFYGQSGKFDVYCKPCSALRRNQSRRADDDLSGREWRFVKANWLVEGVVRCAYCGDKTESPTRDHVQPLANGGETAPRNIVPACKSCNASKSTKPATKWYVGSDIYDPARWKKINDHLEGSTPIPR
jgi:hypothetical protein